VAPRDRTARQTPTEPRDFHFGVETLAAERCALRGRIDRYQLVARAVIKRGSTGGTDSLLEAFGAAGRVAEQIRLAIGGQSWSSVNLRRREAHLLVSVLMI
jgi:hypothetical protein